MRCYGSFGGPTLGGEDYVSSGVRGAGVRSFVVAVRSVRAVVVPALRRRTSALGSVNELTRPLFPQYFNQVTPENAGKWGSAAGTTRTAAMRWTQPRPGVQLRPDQRHPVQLPRPACGATSSRRGWRRCRAEEQLVGDQEVVRGRRGALPEHRVAAGRQRAAARSARLHALGQPGQQLQRQRQLRAGARRRQRHRRHGLGLDPQRLPAGQAVLPQHQADAQRLQHHQLRPRDRRSTCRSSTSSSART